VKHGWYHEGDLHLDHTYVAQMRPFYRVIGSPAHELDDIHEGYDGSAWEYYPDPGIVVRTVGQAARATRHSALFDDVLVDYAQHGIQLQYGGEQTYYGKPVYVIHTKRADGFEEDVFLDRDTYMIDGRAQVVPMHAYGQRYQTHDVYGDYRPEGGVMFAHSDKEIDAGTGKVLDEGGDYRIDINVNLPLSQFAPPQWNRTPLQQMIQRMYDERDEAVPVMATYRDFEALVDKKAPATGDAVDFTGYQILKMGHPDVAVALLQQNVADHPKSARAHFGLGRALQASGDVAGAKAEYAKALAIDPNYLRARTALDQLK
jgi:tetratricopeptide (TPR) repeat protein